MVRRDDVDNGMTHGIPLSGPEDLAGYELVPHPVDPNFPDEKWFSVKVDRAELRELTRTPNYHSWQGERWLFCCGRACVFLGELALADLDSLATKKGRSVSEATACVFGASSDESPELLERIKNQSISTYSFRCRSCGRLRAVWDMD